jgi:hypothetical protein
MNEQNEKQAIEEMRELIHAEIKKAVDSGLITWTEFAQYLAGRLTEKGYLKQIEAVWVARICEFSDGTKMVEEYNCSNCLHEEGDNDKHFCPNCVAKMKGGAE